jgi:RalA-binding protein 1
VDDENAYRHAFLIIEAKKTSSGSHIRHVLCASSDVDRDAWVDVLVRHVAGTFDDSYGSGSSPGPSMEGHSRQSVGSIESQRPTPTRPRTLSNNNDIVRAGGAGLSSPLQQHDPSSAKLFHSGPPQPEGISPTERPMGLSDAQLALRMIERGNSGGNMSGVTMSTSLPSSLEPSITQGPPSSASYSTPQQSLQSSSQTSLPRRASSEQGFYPESRGAIVDQRVAPKSRLEKPPPRASNHPTLPTVDSSPSKQQYVDSEQGSDVETGPGGKKISGPSNATPIPPGQSWGNKQPLLSTNDNPTSDRERKVKSKFWPSFNRMPGVGGIVSGGSGSGSDRDRSNAGVPPPGLNPARVGGDPTMGGRAVFAVPLEQALTVAQIANLPAIVFRCIEYLEAKKADEEEGIYRLSGSSAVIKSLKDRFNAGRW